MRAYAPSIAQGEGMSLGEWRIGVFLGVPSPSIKSDKKHHIIYKVIVNKICISDFFCLTAFDFSLTFSYVCCLFSILLALLVWLLFVDVFTILFF